MTTEGRVLRALLAVLLLPALLALVPLVPLPPAGAQTVPVLVSNLGQVDDAETNLTVVDTVQAFTTGSHAAGYLLSSVDLVFGPLTDADAASKLAVSVNADAGGVPGTVLATLAWPAFSPSSSAQTLRFEAPGGGVRLAADTTYFVVLDSTAAVPFATNEPNKWASIFNFALLTSADQEDSGGAVGWSIADEALYRASMLRPDQTRSYAGAVDSLKIGLNGGPSSVSAPSVVFVREGETVSVRLDLARQVTGSVPVTASSSDPSRVLVNHPDVLFMGRKYVNPHDVREGAQGVLVQTNRVSGDSQGAAVRTRPSGSISFDFTARDWAGYTSIEEPALHKGYRVVEVTAVPTGADGLPSNGPDEKFELEFSSSDPSVAFAPITVVVKRSRGLDPVFSPDPKSGFHCRELECLRVGEGHRVPLGDSVQYTVRNFNVPAPGSPLTITPTGEGLSFDPPVVSWTHLDHDELRTVTVTADHDSDVRSDTRIIRHVFSENWDTSGSLSRIPGAAGASSFNLAVRVVDDDLAAFDAVGADGAVIGQVNVSSRAGESRSGLGRFWVRVDGPPDCTTGYDRSAGLCWDTLRIRLRTGRPDGTWDNAPVAATVHRADQAGASPSSYTKVAGPRHWYAMHIRPEHWDRLLRVDLTLDPALHGSSGSYDISMSLERDNGEPSAHRQVTVSYGPNLETSPSVDDNSIPVSDSDDAPGDAQDAPDSDDAPVGVDSASDPAPYGADPQVVAAVQYLASQTHHGFAHVNRWQRALAAIGALDPADVTGGALSLAEARRNADRYSSPVWDQVVAEIEAKQAHDTAQQQQQQQPVGDGQQPPPPLVVPEVAIGSSTSAVNEGSAVSFTVAASPAPAADLAVSVTIAAAGDYGVTTGTRTVTILAGSSSATLTVPTVGDTTDEPDGTITATVDDGDGYTVGAAATATVTVSDDDDPPAAYVMDPALIAEVQAHIASFTERRHHAGIRDWTAVLDRLEGRSGAMSDDRIAAWLDRSRRHGWADGIDTLPKVQAALTAQAAAS